MPKYVTYREVRKSFDVSAQTVKNWALRNSINYKTIQNKTKKTWLYDLESIGNFISNTKQDSNIQEFNRIIYTRVSSKKQEQDLERQANLLSAKYPDSEVIKDIGSGLNYKRNGFNKLLSKIFNREVNEIVVTYKDRLLRFGFELFEKICIEYNCKILVYSEDKSLIDVEENETRELQEDLLSIINVFVARRNGKRAGLLKNERKKEKNKSKLNEESENLS